MEWTDLIGKTLDSYTQLETAKIGARLAQTNEQAIAYDYPERSAAINEQRGAMTNQGRVMVAAGVLGLVALVWLVARK